MPPCRKQPSRFIWAGMRPAYFILYGFADRNKKTKEVTKSRVKITLIVKQAEFTTDSIANEKKANTNAITVYARWERVEDDFIDSSRLLFP